MSEKSKGEAQYQIPRKWTTVAEGRQCGECSACCTWLGIEELRKWTGQACKHLDGRDPTKRCTIYSKRPKACVEYHCLWRAGWGPDELRPDKSGMILTSYPRNEDKPGIATTVLIFDEEKAGSLPQTVAMELIMIDLSEVRVVNFKRKVAVLYADGSVYRCKLLPPDSCEALVFQADGRPIATYEVRNPKEPADDSTT